MILGIGLDLISINETIDYDSGEQGVVLTESYG